MFSSILQTRTSYYHILLINNDKFCIFLSCSGSNCQLISSYHVLTKKILIPCKLCISRRFQNSYVSPLYIYLRDEVMGRMVVVKGLREIVDDLEDEREGLISLNHSPTQHGPRSGCLYQLLILRS